MRGCRSCSTRTSTASTPPCRPPARCFPRPARTRSSSTARPPAEPAQFTFRYWVNDVTPPTATAAVADSWPRRPAQPSRRRHAIGGRLEDGFRTHRRRRARDHVRQRPGARQHPRPRSRPTSPAVPGLRLPGDAQHGECRRSAAQHATAADDDRRPPAPVTSAAGRSRRSWVARRDRARRWRRSPRRPS